MKYSCLLLSVYLPCDNHTNNVSVEYIECIVVLCLTNTGLGEAQVV